MHALEWLIGCLFIHYSDGYRHGYAQAMSDAARASEKTRAVMAETQAMIEGMIAKLDVAR